MVQGLFDLVAAVYQSIDKEIGAFRTGTGLAWADHHPSLFTATERAFRPGYQSHLVQEWIPAVGGLHEKLTRGARVADVGCGHGASTVVLASAYPTAVSSATTTTPPPWRPHAQPPTGQASPIVWSSDWPTRPASPGRTT